MNQKKRQALAVELAKDLKAPEDLSALSAQLTKITVEAALKVGLDNHLGNDKSDPDSHHSGNSRTGCSSKKLMGGHGEIELQAPRDRSASFEPQQIKKGQARTTAMVD